MIHTFQLFFILHHEEVQDLQRKLGIKYTEVNQYYDGVYPGVTMSLTICNDGKWRLYMVVDAIKLLDKPDILENDYEKLEQQLKYILINIFGHASHYKNHVLLRFDYRYDVPIIDKNHRLLLMHLYKKMTKLHRFQKKYLGRMENGIYIPYKTTVYHSSKSVESTVYLKEEERKENGKKVEYYEKDIVRFEVRLKRDHLYYMERKKEKNNRSRQLKEYLKESVYKEYFKTYIMPIYHLCDFYKIDEARKKLKSSTLSTQTKLKLIQFLKQVSSYDLDTPLKGMSKGTFKSRLTLLHQVGINPILIPKNHSPNAPSSMKNPLNNFL